MDGLGNPLRLVLTGGQEHDITPAGSLMPGYSGAYVIADKGYDAQWLRVCIAELGMAPALPRHSNWRVAVVYDVHLYGERHLVECLIHKVKRYRRVFMRFDQLGVRCLGFWHFAAALVWRR